MEWQAARAADRRSFVVRTPPGVPVVTSGLLLLRLLGSAVPSAGYLAGSTAFPQGSFGRERP